MLKRNVRWGAMFAVALMALVISTPAKADLVNFALFNGNVGLSTDGFGSVNGIGTITANAPVGSTVVAAYLYSGYYNLDSVTLTPSVNLNGTAVSFGANVNNTSACCGIGSARADVTSIVAPIINGGAGGTYSFNVQENTPENSSHGLDGEALVVVYSNPTLPTSTVGLLDGFANVTGNTASINFSSPLDPSAPGFFAEMRIGDSFSCCGQASQITVNGTTITNEAGNNDDSQDGGLAANGDLITVGGWNDPFSPLLPDYASDHERYDLTPEIHNGDTAITVNSFNTTQDDNIFLEAFYVSGNATVTTNGTPEPATFGMIGGALVALGAIRRRLSKV